MWDFKGKVINEISDLPDGVFGFIYRITNLENQKIYIGKKFLHHTVKKKVGNRIRKVQKESDWKSYCGSNKQLKGDIKAGNQIKKEILHVCSGRKQLTYYELKYLFLNEVLERDDFYNENISGKFYKRDT
jgi:hypothetical protein